MLYLGVILIALVHAVTAKDSVTVHKAEWNDMLPFAQKLCACSHHAIYKEDVIKNSCNTSNYLTEIPGALYGYIDTVCEGLKNLNDKFVDPLPNTASPYITSPYVANVTSPQTNKNATEFNKNAKYAADKPSLNNETSSTNNVTATGAMTPEPQSNTTADYNSLNNSTDSFTPSHSNVTSPNNRTTVFIPPSTTNTTTVKSASNKTEPANNRTASTAPLTNAKNESKPANTTSTKYLANAKNELKPANTTSTKPLANAKNESKPVNTTSTKPLANAKNESNPANTTSTKPLANAKNGSNPANTTSTKPLANAKNESKPANTTSTKHLANAKNESKPANTTSTKPLANAKNESKPANTTFIEPLTTDKNGSQPTNATLPSGTVKNVTDEYHSETNTNSSTAATGHYVSDSNTKMYSLGTLLIILFCSFGTGILVAIASKMFYNTYQRRTYEIPLEQHTQNRC